MPPRLPPKRFAAAFWRKLNDDNVFNGAAALGFYLTLAIFPAMILAMAVIPYLPVARVDQAIMDLLRQALPASAADVFARVVDESRFADYDATYGSIGTVIVLMLWLYIAGLVTLAGSVINVLLYRGERSAAGPRAGDRASEDRAAG